MKYRAYLRCSTNSQTLARQEEQLKNWCKDNHVNLEKDVIIYREIRTGKNAERPVLKQFTNDLQPSECALFCELSRAHRNMANVKKMWQDLTDRGVYICIMDYKMLDTRPKEDNSLASKLVTAIMLDVIAFITEEELRMKEERTQNGIAAAKEKGVICHRPKLTLEKLPKEFIKVYNQNKNKLNKKQILTLVNAELRQAQKPEIKSRVTFDKYINLLQNKD